MRAGIYGRLSVVRPNDGDRGHEPPIKRQLGDCHKWVQDHDGEVVRTYDDPGISGYSGAHRPDFERLLNDLADREIDTVVCWKLDRLCRNHKDFQRLWDLCEDRGARLVSLSEMFDSTTAAGEFVIRLMVGMAKMESDNISLRTSRGLEAVRAAGRPHTGGARHFGYTDAGEVVPAEAETVRWAATAIIDGVLVQRTVNGGKRVEVREHSLKAVTDELAARGIRGTKGKPLGRREVKRLLCSPRIAGKVEHQGEIVGDGKWEAILDEATWKTIKAILEDPTRASQVGRPPKYLLAGFLRCGMDGCGAKMISRPLRSHGRNKPNYVCVATGKLHLTIAAAPVEELVTERVLDRLDRDGLAAVLAARTKQDDSKQIAKQLADDETALLELSDDFYQHRIISKPEFLRQRGPLESRIAKATAELTRLAQQQEIVGLPAMPGALRRQWPSLSLELRRAVLRLVLDRVIIMPADRPRRTVDPDRVVIPEDAWLD
jgi:site-specific DNA recombinase